MSESEKKLLLQNIRVLQEKTGLSLQICKQALSESGNDIDKALRFLKEEILKKCSDDVIESAKRFLDLTGGNIEENEDIEALKDSFFEWAQEDWNTYKKDLECLTEEENEEFGWELRALYDEALERIFPEYVQREGESPQSEKEPDKSPDSSKKKKRTYRRHRTKTGEHSWKLL